MIYFKFYLKIVGKEINKIINREKLFKELFEFIKSYISLIINKKLKEENEKFINTNIQFNPSIVLTNKDQINREHVLIKPQFEIEYKKYS